MSGGSPAEVRDIPTRRPGITSRSNILKSLTLSTSANELTARDFSTPSRLRGDL